MRKEYLEPEITVLILTSTQAVAADGSFDPDETGEDDRLYDSRWD